ncbi:MAG: inositol monophosphatase [Planctomycetota bacterium]|nr:MAG: inositol monophosphatase [Planctomycetota bacterium]
MTQTTPPDLDELQAFAIELALEAGALQLEGLSTRPQVEHKSKKELVTPVDRACEERIVARIRARFPDHGILAEEGHQAPGACRWIIDPIDGTSNFAARIPLFCVSIGIEVEGDPAVGVVYAPYLDELFYGRRGGGAFFRRGTAEARPLTVSRTARLEDAILATGFAYVQDETPNHNLDNWVAVKRRARALRRMGSAALDLAYVADGRFDGFWELHLKPYDVAAGAVLVREAGGRVTDFLLGGDWLHGQHILATNGAIHQELHGALAPVRPDPWVRLPPA